jgi:RHS repeat-associated protein
MRPGKNRRPLAGSSGKSGNNGGDATSRLLRSTLTGSPDTLHACDALARQAAVTDVFSNTVYAAYDSAGHQKSAKPKAQSQGDRDFEAVRTHGARRGNPRRSGNRYVTEYVGSDGAVAARYEYDPFGNTTAMSGPMADTFPFRFSTKYFDAETGFYYYGYRYYSPELGRWLNRDPIEEEGGLNLYGFVGNDPVNRWDRLGLEFGITYVQFEGLLGHGWIRTGDFQTYDITTMFAQTITYNGTIYQVNSATAVLPVGIGFYPSVEVTPLQALIGVPGQWKYEQEKELVAVSAKDMLKQWDTELKTRRLFGIRAAIFKYGSAKDKCCKDANRDDVLGCIMDYKNKHPRSTYRLPFLSCRSRAKDALEACCLKVGGRIPTTVGEVRINVMPIGSAP